MDQWQRAHRAYVVKAIEIQYHSINNHCNNDNYGHFDPFCNI